MEQHKVKNGLKNVLLHAELQLFKVILEDPKCKLRTEHITGSKRCCFLCSLFFELWNDCVREAEGNGTDKLPRFVIEGTHGKC